MSFPRVFTVRHGATEWSLSHKHTGITDVPLVQIGIEQVEAISRTSVGRNSLISPSTIVKVLCSPMQRARHTLELLNLGIEDDRLPWKSLVTPTVNSAAGEGCVGSVEIDPRLSEWDYGDYEGLTTEEIRQLRKIQGLDKGRNWDIMKDGCMGGESPMDITARIDSLISDIKIIHEMQQQSRSQAKDILCVAHGHILTALALRWAGSSLEDAPRMVYESGGVLALGYENHNPNEPAILLGEGCFTA